MSFSSGKLEVGDRICAMDERRGVDMPGVVIDVDADGRFGRIRFELDGGEAVVRVEDVGFEAEAS